MAEAREDFEGMVTRYAERIYRFARRFADAPGAEDLVQETMVRAHGAYDRFAPGRPVLPWLYRIASNLAISRARSSARRAARHERLRSRGVDAPPDGLACAEANERRAIVRAAVDDLPPLYREIVALYYLEDMDLADVAGALEIPVGTAKVRLFRARALLKTRLAGLLSDDGAERSEVMA